jgi:hypothetical protein
VRPHDASDAADEPYYAAAPLPAHERTWRHPSEVGQSNWESTEPPIAIGRGLFLTTTAIGFVLGIAVLFLLAPMSDSDLAATSRSAWPAVRAEGVANTVLVDHQRSSTSRSSNALPVAVAVGHHELMITTANAVMHATIGNPDDVSIVGTLDDAAGTVVSVVGALAFILPASDVDVISFDSVRSALPGQVLTVLTDEPTEIVYGRQPVGGVDETGIREGTPVVDNDGALVALCTLTRRAGAVQVDLVPVPHAAPPVTAQRPTTSTDPTD